MSRIFKALFIVAALISGFNADAQFLKRLKPSAATVKANNNKKQVVTVDPDEPLLTTDIATPVVPDKLANAIKASMMQQAESLHHLGYDVKSTRNGQVLIVTIPVEKMFAPNETGLQEVYARQLLEPFCAYLRTPGRYKIVLAVHTDDTGDPAYTEKLSDQRALAVSQWFEQNAENEKKDKFLTPFFPIYVILPFGASPHSLRACLSVAGARQFCPGFRAVFARLPPARKNPVPGTGG
ncbi:MAG: OmpA family protein [Muribaculaceae bacterium]|nr:OmpA family protein [Muribaculaceae bacterium]